MQGDPSEVIEALLAGCDPETGEILGPLAGSVLRREKVQRALHAAVKALAKPARATVRPPLHPVPEGHPLSRLIFSGDKPVDIVRELKAGYGSHLVFVQNGYFWEAYEDDAHACHEVFGWKVAEVGNAHVFTGVPANAFRFKEKLESRSIPYIMVGQVEYPSTGPVVERKVIELFDV